MILKVDFSRWYCSKSKPEFKVTNTKLYVPVVTLLTQDNVKLLKQSKSGFKRTINWNKYQMKYLKHRTKHKTDI